MNLGLGWPDLIIIVVLGIATYKGFSRGFVAELGGMVALVAALISPWYYNGAFDGWLESTFKLGDGSAHVIGMFLCGFVTYAIVIAASWVLDRFAKLPVLNIGNSIGGALVGLLKGTVLIWLVLFIALYFPLTPDIRRDLHASRLAGYFTGPDASIDKAVLGVLPDFARESVEPYFARHHV
jgi:membrane protein required for colicin V production